MIDRELLKQWEDTIHKERLLREVCGKPVILTADNKSSSVGYNIECPECKSTIKVRQKDFGKYLYNALYECPQSKAHGHGWWGTFLNMILN
jgi:DNA-directed RNA polymerase subunit RPC12/RpoP